ncbi:hypothetical protein [Malikia sp.]|uniref:hypothetical protein n=1 Tax=Malikia sp. TaxID=2070706 RepID=UPI0026122069|nr:hypothetical protein [Malikia sp.]MDD2729042.1 hypothetical protein [Malikia sp.]
MGFWSSIGSAISGAARAVGSVVSSVASTVKNVASKAWEKTKEVVAKAVNWMAEKAETFVGSVKKVWQSVRPFIDTHVRPLVQAAAKVAPWPWLKGALTALDKGLAYVSAFDRSPLAKKLDYAIRWVINAAKNMKETLLKKPEEVEQANERKQVFEEAIAQMPAEEAKSIQLAAMINDFVLVQTAIKNTFDKNEISDFEHYLRLRATQKLLKYAEQTLNGATDIEQISEDDIFLLKASAGLLASKPELSNADAVRLDDIIQKRYRKKLIPFVFEEMVMAWGQNLGELEKQLKTDTTTLSKNTVLLRRLEMAKKISDISAEEEIVLNQMKTETAALKSQVDALSAHTREKRNYVYAAEGFLQTLEKSQEELIAEGRDYLAEEGGQVGMIIIDCAQHGRKWETLSEEDQMLIIDYANIFKEESEIRAQQLIEVEVGA